MRYAHVLVPNAVPLQKLSSLRLLVCGVIWAFIHSPPCIVTHAINLAEGSLQRFIVRILPEGTSGQRVDGATNAARVCDCSRAHESLGRMRPQHQSQLSHTHLRSSFESKLVHTGVVEARGGKLVGSEKCHAAFSKPEGAVRSTSEV